MKKIGGEKRTIFLMQIKDRLPLSFSIFLFIFLLFLFCPFDVSPYLYLISYLPSSRMITFSFHRGQKKHLPCVMGSHLILPHLPLLEGSLPFGGFVSGTEEYGRSLQRVLCFWDTSQTASQCLQPHLPPLLTQTAHAQNALDIFTGLNSQNREVFWLSSLKRAKLDKFWSSIKLKVLLDRHSLPTHVSLQIAIGI